MKREEYKHMEDLRLVKHFADWLSKIGEKKITEENFEEDLLDGVALCTVMSKINGSGLTSFHTLKESSVPSLDIFKAKENLVAFQEATRKLKLPISFGTEDLEKKNTTRVVSTLIFLAHVAHSQNIMVAEMDKEILSKVVEMDQALEQQAASSQLTWFQQLLIKLGLGDWISLLSIDAIKEYLTTLKHNIEHRVEIQKENLHGKIAESTASFKEKTATLPLPDTIKAKINAI